MKYAVFSTYRTASTLMHEIIRNHFGITDLGELTGQIPLDKRSDETLRHSWLSEQLALESYVVKLFSYTLRYKLAIWSTRLTRSVIKT